MRIMVSGGAGYIGSHAVRRLLDDGHYVLVIDNLCHGHRPAIDRRSQFLPLDINDRTGVAAALKSHGIDSVMHFAAFIEVGESVENPAKYYQNNLVGGLSLLAAMADAGVGRFVFSSTAAVYGVPQRPTLDEEHPCLPINPYGRSKRLLEEILADYAQAYGLAAVALRYFNVAGAAADGSLGEAHEPESHLIPRLLRVAMAQNSAEVASIYGTDYPTPDGTCIRDYIHVEDLVAAHVLALEHLKPGQLQVYNLGSERGFSVREVIAACRRVTGAAIPAREFPRRAGDPPVLVAASGKIRQAWGWTLRYPDLDTIVQHAWAWHVNHPNGYPTDRNH